MKKFLRKATSSVGLATITAMCMVMSLQACGKTQGRMRSKRDSVNRSYSPAATPGPGGVASVRAQAPELLGPNGVGVFQFNKIYCRYDNPWGERRDPQLQIDFQEWMTISDQQVVIDDRLNDHFQRTRCWTRATYKVYGVTRDKITLTSRQVQLMKDNQPTTDPQCQDLLPEQDPPTGVYYNYDFRIQADGNLSLFYAPIDCAAWDEKEHDDILNEDDFKRIAGQ